MTNIKHVNSVVDRDFRNRINQLIDAINVQGKSIQDLVADGQLTVEQYAELLTTINSLVKSGYVDKSDLSPEFKDEIERFSAQLAQKATKEEVSNALDGSPKGTYATLTDLQTAFPTGRTGVYLVQADGHIYSWDGTAWIDRGLYQAVGIADKSIEDKHLKKLYLTAKRTNNIFDGLHYQGYIVQTTTGNLIVPSVDANLYFTTDFLDVYGLTNIITSTIDLSYFAFYDANKIYISGGNTSANKLAPIQVPKGAYFVRLSTTTKHIPNYMVNSGTTVMPYEPYRTIDMDSIKNDSIPEEKLAPITPKKTTFFKHSVNLFNKKETVDGFYVGSGDGLTKANASYCYVEIEVTPNTSYSRNYIDQIAFFTSNGVYIGGLGMVGDSTTFITPSNCYIAKVSLPINKKETYQIQLGEVVTDLEPFGSYLHHDYIPYEVFGKRALQSIISPIRSNTLQIKLLGDSITHGVGGTGFAEDGELVPVSYWKEFHVNTSGICWANSLKDYLLEKFNCTVKNWGCSGVTSKFIKDNLSTLVEASDDIVIVMIGTNDRANQNNVTQNQLYDNLISIGNYVRDLGKEIIFMSSVPASISNETDTSSSGVIKNYHMEDVDTIIMAVSDYFKQEYISLYKEVMNYCDLKDITIDSLLADGLHPNDTGYTVMFNIICDNLGIGRKRVGATW